MINDNHNNEHDHVHDENCSCGEHEHSHSHDPALALSIFEDGELNDSAASFMGLLNTHKFLPCARFVVKSSKESSFSNVVLSPVFVTDGTEQVSVLRSIGDILIGLELNDYISIDFDIPLEGFDYSYFYESAAFKLLEQTVAEAKDRDGFLGDTATIEFGSIAPLN